MMRVILIGMKGCGKTTVGMLLAERLQVPFIDSDAEIERTHQRERGEALSFRQIFNDYGEAYFRALEMRTLKRISGEFGRADFVFACGGRTPLQDENQGILVGLGKIVFLNPTKGVLLKRILAQGIPAFFPYQDDPERSLNELVAERLSVYKKLADVIVDIGEEATEEVVHTILTKVENYEKN
jgi:shikimate kinase